MSTYKPDLWVLCRFESNADPGESGRGHIHYRILASWYGGFTEGDSWKLSSGLENGATIGDDGSFVLPQSSGSTYVVYPSIYGMSGYTSSVAANFADQAKISNGEIRIDILEKEDAIDLLTQLVRGEIDV